MRTHNCRRWLRRSCWWFGHLHVSPHSRQPCIPAQNARLWSPVVRLIARAVVTSSLRASTARAFVLGGSLSHLVFPSSRPFFSLKFAQPTTQEYSEFRRRELNSYSIGRTSLPGFGGLCLLYFCQWGWRWLHGSFKFCSCGCEGTTWVGESHTAVRPNLSVKRGWSLNRFR